MLVFLLAMFTAQLVVVAWVNEQFPKAKWEDVRGFMVNRMFCAAHLGNLFFIVETCWNLYELSPEKNHFKVVVQYFITSSVALACMHALLWMAWESRGGAALSQPLLHPTKRDKCKPRAYGACKSLFKEHVATNPDIEDVEV